MTKLTPEDYRIIDLKYRINHLNKIATFIPTRRMILRANPLNNITFKKPDTVDYERYNIGKYLSYGEENNNIIREFIKTLENYSSIINVNSLYKNLQSLQISKSELNLMEKLEKRLGLNTNSGNYSPVKNTINLNIDNEGTEKSTLTHELIHFASTVKQNSMTYTGFAQYNDGLYSSKGNGINEGATEFINKTLFGYHDYSYGELVDIVTGISNLIGTERLIQLYFDNDLKGLIEEISKYTDEKTATSIIKGMDNIYKINYENIRSDPSKTTTTLSKNIVSLMTNINLKKLKKSLENTEITEEEYKKEKFEKVDLYEFSSTVTKTTSISNKPLYKVKEFLFTEKEYNKLIEEYNRKTSEPGLNKKRKYNYLIETIHQISGERRKNIEKNGNLYGSVKGYKDNDDNSLDEVKFAYKIFDDKLAKAMNEGISTIEVADSNGTIHRIGFTTAFLMSNEIDTSIENDYINSDFHDNKEENELNHIMDDYDKSLKENESNINKEK